MFGTGEGGGGGWNGTYNSKLLRKRLYGNDAIFASKEYFLTLRQATNRNSANRKVDITISDRFRVGKDSVLRADTVH